MKFEDGNWECGSEWPPRHGSPQAAGALDGGKVKVWGVGQRDPFVGACAYVLFLFLFFWINLGEISQNK